MAERLEGWRKASETPVLNELKQARAHLASYESLLDGGETLGDDAVMDMRAMAIGFSHAGFALYGAKVREYARLLSERATLLYARYLIAKHGAQ